MADIRPADPFGFPLHIDEIVHGRVTQDQFQSETKAQAEARELADNAAMWESIDKARAEKEARDPYYYGQCECCTWFGWILKSTNAHEDCKRDRRD